MSHDPDEGKLHDQLAPDTNFCFFVHILIYLFALQLLHVFIYLFIVEGLSAMEVLIHTRRANVCA